ncbi:MAG TPA: c-type cytochrome domain-containing protein [Puia sp.]|jgi:uncharacterized membrane protein|nr:c-type cytochrome domain-containing protein [Puia sp.]
MAAALTFIGRLHPLLVHLPIGILLLAILLEALSMRRDYAGLKPAADLSLLIGWCSAVLSCFTGWLLSRTGDYDPGLVVVHQWLAISLTIVSAGLYFVLRGRPVGRWGGAAMGLSVVLLILTGHWGGSLTHGPGYLTAGLGPEAAQPTLRPVADIRSAVVYPSMVEPVLHDNCYGCHSAARVKGGLRLDGPDRILRGGKDGQVIVAGQSAASLLVKRIGLPLDDEHHMAPKEKGQLTPVEIRLLRWWIDNGASFDKSVGALPQDTGMAAVWQAFHMGTAGPVVSGAIVNVADSDLPMGPAPQAPALAVQRLRAAGALVLPIAQGSNYLEVVCLSDTLGQEALKAIPMLKDQLVSLKCSWVRGGDQLVSAAAACPRLVRLWLDHTAITGANLGELRALANLKYLNLTGTAVDAADVKRLKGLPKIAELYLYGTKVGREDWVGLRRDFPRVVLDSGGYTIPVLVTDTAIVRAPVKKN